MLRVGVFFRCSAKSTLTIPTNKLGQGATSSDVILCPVYTSIRVSILLTSSIEVRVHITRNYYFAGLLLQGTSPSRDVSYLRRKILVLEAAETTFIAQVDTGYN